MDCHVFRRLCDELAPALMGCRIEKIHRPAKDVTLFTLYGTGGKRFLFLRAGRKAPFLFLSTHKIPVGSAPPADIMRLRKYLADRRIIDVLPDWVGRRLYLHVNADTECWLTLDLREGPSLLFDAPPEPEIPAWPDPAHWAEACEGDGWRNWPVITPPLAPARRTSRPAPRSGGRRRRSFPLRERRRGTRAFRMAPAARTTPRRRRHAA